MFRLGLVLFAIGATLGSALDAIHTHSGTTSYPHPVAFMMAWWTPLLFGFAGLSVGLSHVTTERLVKKEVAPRASFPKALAAFGVFVTMYFVSGYLPASNVVKLVVLALGAAIIGVTTGRTRLALVLAMLTSIIGPGVEATLVAVGAFKHLQPDFVGIPMWLPALYASGAFAFGVLGRTIANALAITPSSDAGSLP